MLRIPIIAFCAALLLAGCGSSSSVNSAALPPLPAPDGQGQPGPAVGTSRAGVSYDVNIPGADGNIAFTVHEPSTLVGGQTYPLLLNGPGFGLVRENAALRDVEAPAGTPLADIQTTAQYTNAGYGVISFDQHGFGQSGGTVTIMDPDHDGPNLIKIVDWAEVNLNWVMYRPDASGNPGMVLGSYGGSYGGMYQYLLNNIDPRHRLKAMAPAISPYELGYSLGSGGVPKSGYGLALTALGEDSLATGEGGMDPAALGVLEDGLENNVFTASDYAYLHYHSNAYFCEGVTQPGKRPATHPPKVDVLLLQGMSDALFNLNEAKANYDCLSASGGDVRLYTYVIGHVLPAGAGLAPTNEGLLPTGAPGLSDDYRCGPYVADALTRLWFDAKLKQDPAAIAQLATMPNTCINLGTSGEGVVVNSVPVGGSNSVPIAVTAVPELAPVPMTVPLYTATTTTVVAGIPTATLTLADPNATPALPAGLPLGVSSNDAIIYVSVGVSRAGAVPAALEILGDQIRPVRGFGTQTLQLNGIGVKLNAGDQLSLVIAGQALTQYPLIIARNPLLPTVNVSGSVQLPVLGNVSTLN
ncbi:MAG: CocE/NonD family hydrolase [Stenotrophobium sp.]